jgi:DNA primase
MANPANSAKYIIRAKLTADGVVEKPDIVGAVFGQTEGLLGSDMELRDLQKAARIGRLSVDLEHKNGKTTGTLSLPSMLEKAESAVVAAAIETIDRIGPAAAHIEVTSIDDDRSSRRDQVRDRAKELLKLINSDPSSDSGRIVDDIKSAVQVEDITFLKGTKVPAGPGAETMDEIIIVEGRNDVINLLKSGIKNAVAVEGARDIHPRIVELSSEKTTTIFVDGDRGGELIARSVLQTCDVDFVARAPNTREVEELPGKLVMKCLKEKRTADQFISQTGIVVSDRPTSTKKAPASKSAGREGGRDSGRDTRRNSDRDSVSRDSNRRGGRDSERKPREVDSEERAPRGRRPARDGDDEKPARGGREGGRDGGRERKPTPRKPAAAKTAKHDPRASIKETLTGLSGTLKATILDKEGNAIEDQLPVRELADTLRSSKKKVNSVIFDGVITQRLLDIAAEKGIATVVGVKMGNVAKVPENLEILTRDDLQ